MSDMTGSEPPIIASLDHYVGQTVGAVLATPGDASGWSIQLESGITVNNKDETLTDAPDDAIVGQVFTLAVFSELGTEMHFGITTPDGVAGEIVVTLTPTLYTIAGLEGQTEEYYPQAAPTISDSLPPDPSPERVVDGPEEQADADSEE